MSGSSKLSQSTTTRQVSGSSRKSNSSSRLSDFANEFLSHGGVVSSRRGSLSEKLQAVLDNSELSMWATLWHTLMPVLVATSIAISFLQSLELDGKAVVNNSLLRRVDICFNALFFVEAVIRFAVYPGRWTLFTHRSVAQFYFLVDIVSSVPFGIFVVSDCWTPPEHTNGNYGLERFILLCFVPQVRLLKLLRYMETLHLLSYAFVLILEALPSMAYVILMIIWFFASLIVVCEPPENINSLSHAMWLVILTMSTVGYGDVTPITVPGYIVVSALVICSIMYTAMAFGLIGNVFTSVWKDRDRILLSRKMTLRLSQWSYKPHHIPQLFKKFDSEGKGLLDLYAFREMLRAMRLSLSEDRINSLFLQFDIDGGGTIDAKEFVRHLFPNIFNELYGSRMQQEELLCRVSNSARGVKTQSSGEMVADKIFTDELGSFTDESTFHVTC